MIRLQVLAIGVHQKVPIAIVDEDCCFVVQKIPADVIKILLGGGDIDRQREIPTALGGAVVAQALIARYLRLGRAPAIDRFREGQGGHL